MVYLATITSKGQVTIPKPLRQQFNLHPSTKVIFKLHHNQIILQPAKDFLSLKGSIKTNKTYSDKAANQAILKGIRKDYGPKNHRY